jgi:coatomer subunit beta'
VAEACFDPSLCLLSYFLFTNDLITHNLYIYAVFCVKFIAQKQWFICSSGEGFIHVFSYETQEIQNVNNFRAYDDNSRWLPISLAVHPSRPYVLSWCRYDREIMKLWDWDKGWECARTFRSGGINVDHIAFDPKETNRFVATDCLDGKVTVWDFNSLLKKQ